METSHSSQLLKHSLVKYLTINLTLQILIEVKQVSIIIIRY